MIEGRMFEIDPTMCIAESLLSWALWNCLYAYGPVWDCLYWMIDLSFPNHDGDKKKRVKKSGKIDQSNDDDADDDFEMDEDERKEFREKIRQMVEMNPEVEEEVDPEEKRKKMQKLLADYPLVVDEEDPNWPEDADGWGFNFSQFFDKMSIKNVKKDEDDDGYDSEKEVNWEDIRAIKDITSAEWEDIVFSDLSPLVVLVHNRYRRFR
nr:thioredoxin-like fold domain-containing protein MRL7L, chloroplastic [Tanacetum cinerariifolium]